MISESNSYLISNAKFLLVLMSILLSSACQTSGVSPTHTSDKNRADKNSADQKNPAINESPYAVGSSTRFIHDQTRPFDSVAGVDVGVRTLITEVWYPVEHKDVSSGDYRQATYGDYVFADKEVHRLMMTQTTFFHLTPETVIDGVSQKDIDAAIDELFYRPRGSFVDAPLAAASKPWPVVVMTHGDAGSRYNMETVCEYLAAHGYVVIAPEHTGNSPFSYVAKDPNFIRSDDAVLAAKLAEVKPYLNSDGTYGPKDKFGQTYTPLIRNREDPQALVNLDNSLLQRVNDLRATLVELDAMNAAGLFAEHLNLDKIGLIGRSFGGTTTLAGLALEPRFTAGVAVVPLLMPDVRAGLADSFLKPIGQESVILNASGPPIVSTLSKPTMLLSGAEDGLIIGVGAAMADSMGGVQPTVSNPLPPLRSAYEASEYLAVWGLLDNSNHSSFGVSGGYWWPELKSKSQNRFFAPNEQFTLIAPSQAHLIQKTKVLQFFDLMIGNRDVLGDLINNEFTDQGLRYESRNF